MPIIGVFSSRQPGQPATANDVAPYAWHGWNYWVVSTDDHGESLDHQGFLCTSEGLEHLTSQTITSTNAQRTFREESRVIANTVQIANDELMRWLAKHPEDLLRVHPGTFEHIVAELFRDQGYDVEVLGSWNQSDGGIDIIAIRRDTVVGSFRVGIQCKRYVKTTRVKADLVWALDGRLDKFHLNKGVVATTASFEQSVLSESETNLWRIELKDRERLTRDLENWGRYEKGVGGLWLPSN